MFQFCKLFWLLSLGLLVLLKSAKSDDCLDGSRDGLKAAEDLWDTFDENCANALVFERRAYEQLIDYEFIDDSSQNVFDRAYDECARSAVYLFVQQVLQSCLNVPECEYYGELAASLVINAFCDLYGSSPSSVKESCRDAAIDKCKGSLTDKLEELIMTTGSCPALNDDSSNLTFDLLNTLKNNCVIKVNQMIE